MMFLHLNKNAYTIVLVYNQKKYLVITTFKLDKVVFILLKNKKYEILQIFLFGLTPIYKNKMIL